MKRDKRLLREILESIEELEEFKQFYKIKVPNGYTDSQVEYHLRLLRECGAIHHPQPDQHLLAGNLTYAGHDLLDELKLDGVPRASEPQISENPLDSDKADS